MRMGKWWQRKALKTTSAEPSVLFMIFINQLMKQAFNNWTESHVEMLKRLIFSVISHTEYAEVTDEMMENFAEDLKLYKDIAEAMEAENDERR